MRMMKFIVLAGVFCVAPLYGQENSLQPVGALGEIVSKVVARENQEMGLIRQRSPLVETYIQKVKANGNDGRWEPDGDHYFLGQADFSKGLGLEPLSGRDESLKQLAGAGMARFFDFGTEFLPKGFLQMIYLDNGGLDTQNYQFKYVRREFLGEVRTLVFDVDPAKKSAKGRFLGRIWVEDQGFTIVRFDGTYTGQSKINPQFHFDSWRVNAGPNLWLPAFIYAEERTSSYEVPKGHTYKAQTRLWGYNGGQAHQEEELSKILIESTTPVIDKSQQENDLTPVQQNRAWEQQATDNMINKLQAANLVAPRGEIDKILETVVNNLEATNNLNFDPEIQCRVLMTSTLESISIGHTIVLSRGLIDVLPDEASLAAVLAKEIGYILVGYQKLDTKYAFYDRLQFDEKKTFRHFDFERSPADDAAASTKAAELLKNSPYKDQLATAEMFIAELQERSKEIPNLISPRLGDAGLLEVPIGPKTEDQTSAPHIVALALGGRIKLDPWDDSLTMLKAPPVGNIADRDKLPFEIAPFMIYLTRVGGDSPKSSELGAPPQPGN